MEDDSPSGGVDDADISNWETEDDDSSATLPDEMM
jgi:hypothetical protein